MIFQENINSVIEEKPGKMYGLTSRHHSREVCDLKVEFIDSVGSKWTKEYKSKFIKPSINDYYYNHSSNPPNIVFRMGYKGGLIDSEYELEDDLKNSTLIFINKDSIDVLNVNSIVSYKKTIINKRCIEWIDTCYFRDHCKLPDECPGFIYGEDSRGTLAFLDVEVIKE